MSQGAIITFMLCAGICFLLWFNSTLHRGNRQRYMEEQELARRRGMGFSPWSFFGQQPDPYHRYQQYPYRPRRQGGSVFALLFFGVVTLFLLSQFKAGFMDRPAGGENAQQHRVISSSVNSDAPVIEKDPVNEFPGGYSPLDARRKTGIYEPQPIEEAQEAQGHYPKTSHEGRLSLNSEENSYDHQEADNKVLSGFGKQLFAVSDEQNAKASLQQVLDIYPEAQVFVIREQQPNGTYRYKGVIGRFADRSAAARAYPLLKEDYPNSFPVDLEGLLLTD